MPVIRFKLNVIKCRKGCIGYFGEFLGKTYLKLPFPEKCTPGEIEPIDSKCI